MIEKFSFTIQNQKLIFSFKTPFNLAAERSEAANKKLTFSRRWTILKLARTIFSPPAGGEKESPRNLRLARKRAHRVLY